MKAARLGVNIDHLATLRQLRNTPYPSLIEAVRICEDAGAEQITVHLREDRRHIQDDDVRTIRKMIKVTYNLEMAATEEMVGIAKKIRPDWVCLVPEKRTEVTTEGGLDLVRGRSKIARVIESLQKSKIKVSLFVEPSLEAVDLSYRLGANAVELHTGAYCIETQKKKPSSIRTKKHLERILKAGMKSRGLGLGTHAGHGFDLENVRPVAAWEWREHGAREVLFEEFNIGHFIVCRAALVGLERAVREMVSSLAAP